MPNSSRGVLPAKKKYCPHWLEFFDARRKKKLHPLCYFHSTTDTILQPIDSSCMLGTLKLTQREKASWRGTIFCEVRSFPKRAEADWTDKECVQQNLTMAKVLTMHIIWFHTGSLSVGLCPSVAARRYTYWYPLCTAIMPIILYILTNSRTRGILILGFIWQGFYWFSLLKGSHWGNQEGWNLRPSTLPDVWGGSGGK